MERAPLHGRPGDGSAADKLWWYQDARRPAPPVRLSRWRSERRRLALDALACLSLATLCFSQARRETLFRADWDFYNQVPLGVPTLQALVLNIAALAAVGFLAAQALRRARGPARRLAAIVAAVAFLISLNFARMAHESSAGWTDTIGHAGLLAVAGIVLAAALVWPRPALRAIRGAALVASPLAAVTVVHAAWMFLEVTAGPEWRAVDPAPMVRSAPSLRRVVWIVFEELDQHLAFEARPADLQLPEFDRLRRESLYADAARPPSGASVMSMVSLITGRAVVAAEPASPNELELTFADGKTARWSAQPSVFSRARSLGYDTAMIGWRLPYPRVLGASLGAAAWRPSVAHEQARGTTLGLALWNQWESLAPPVHARRLLARRYAELADLALRTAADSRFGLVLLHLPVPRPPGIYDRAAGRLTAWNFTGDDGAYLDNLALADQMMADLRRGLERARLSDRTWIVVSSDQWRRSSTRHDGPVQPRVPFLVRPPHGGRGTHVDAPFSTLITHDLVLAVLSGSVADVRTAAAWIERQAPPPTTHSGERRPVR
jgi:hypothetical protein